MSRDDFPSGLRSGPAIRLSLNMRHWYGIAPDAWFLDARSWLVRR